MSKGVYVIYTQRQCLKCSGKGQHMLLKTSIIELDCCVHLYLTVLLYSPVRHKRYVLGNLIQRQMTFISLIFIFIIFFVLTWTYLDAEELELPYSTCSSNSATLRDIHSAIITLNLLLRYLGARAEFWRHCL